MKNRKGVEAGGVQIRPGNLSKPKPILGRNRVPIATTFSIDRTGKTGKRNSNASLSVT